MVVTDDDGNGEAECHRTWCIESSGQSGGPLIFLINEIPWQGGVYIWQARSSNVTVAQLTCYHKRKN